MNISNDVLTSPLFGITLSVGSYLFGQWLYRVCRSFPLFHPVLVAVVPVILVLELTGLDFHQYLESTRLFTLLLGTATVALAIPLYQQLDLIRSHAIPIMVTLVAGAVFAPLAAVGIAWLAGATDITLLSIAPKTVTTPIAMAVAESMGGLTTVAAGTVITVGIFGAVVGPPVMDRMGITSPTVRGFTLGLTSHAVGTARAFEISPVCGAFSSLALALTGALTAFFMPLVWNLISG